MNRTAQGIVHGRIIELTEDLGLADGETVTVEIIPNTVAAPIAEPRKWGTGITKTAGAMAPYWTAQDDEILDNLRQARKLSPRELPE